MSVSALFGLVLLLIGVFLIGYGASATQTLTNKVVGGLTGRYTSRTMWFLLGGGFLVILGGALIFFARHGSHALFY